MRRLKLKLNNCYGIKKLEYIFNFSETGNTFAIYAPNGVMKTSFAKTFNDVSNGATSSDMMFSKRETTRELKNEDDKDISEKEVFVIEPYNQDFRSEKISTLLVNKALKENYDRTYLNIEAEKDKLLIELKSLSGLRDKIEEEISYAFTSEPDRFFDSLVRIEKEILDETEPLYSDILYKAVYNEKTLAFLRTKDFQKKIEQYIRKYDELIEGSKYFKRGVFNHNNASIIAKSLMDNGFFKANHSLFLNTKSEKNEIHTQEELEKVIEDEKEAILNNKELLAAFEELDNKLKANKELREFRDYLLLNQKILPELNNLESFRQKLWLSYLKTRKEFYFNLLGVYSRGKDELNKIIKRAKTETTHWINVIRIFNERFSVPFKLEMVNQEDVILKKDVPSIDFVFSDSKEEVRVDKSKLLNVLSSGEKRALYILNIIFEVEARKEEKQETLFIVDDVADSFDYKNKYAIIEYLMDISESEIFKQIILTHNFDFFRTISSRFVRREQCLITDKTDEGLELREAPYLRSPFKHMKKHLEKEIMLIAAMPFARNIVEYTKGTEDVDYLKLTSMLHIKEDTANICKKDLLKVYENVLSYKPETITDESKKIVEIIFENADRCCKSAECMDLENKIVLSIAIRLKAECFIINRICPAEEIHKNQTRQLIEQYKKKYSDNKEEQHNVKTLELVNLMTPENIHINSFMYEPILDMSEIHLKKLYNDLNGMMESSVK